MRTATRSGSGHFVDGAGRSLLRGPAVMATTGGSWPNGTASPSLTCDPAVMAAAERCFHCALPIPTGCDLTVDIEGEQSPSAAPAAKPSRI